MEQLVRPTHPLAHQIYPSTRNYHVHVFLYMHSLNFLRGRTGVISVTPMPSMGFLNPLKERLVKGLRE